MSDLTWLFLAQRGPGETDFFRRMSESMRWRGSAFLFLGVLALLVAAFLFIRWLGITRARQRTREKDSPIEVFRVLMRRHGLTTDELRAMELAATARRLPDPGVLFARPSIFDRCLERYVRDIGDDELRRRATAEVTHLREKVFGLIDAGTEAAAYDEVDYEPLLD